MSPALSVSISRAYKRLERRGLVVRISEAVDGRTTSLAPTEAGLKLAHELATQLTNSISPATTPA